MKAMSVGIMICPMGITNPKSRRQKGRLYAVAKGRGGSFSVGLYNESWNMISFLLDGYSSARYRRVKTEREGMDSINDFYKSKGLHRPKWMRSRHANYPSLRNSIVTSVQFSQLAVMI